MHHDERDTYLQIVMAADILLERLHQVPMVGARPERDALERAMRKLDPPTRRRRSSVPWYVVYGGWYFAPDGWDAGCNVWQWNNAWYADWKPCGTSLTDAMSAFLHMQQCQYGFCGIAIEYAP